MEKKSPGEDLCSIINDATKGDTWRHTAATMLVLGGRFHREQDIVERIITFRKVSSYIYIEREREFANRPFAMPRDHLFKIGNESSSLGNVVIAHVFPSVSIDGFYFSVLSPILFLGNLEQRANDFSQILLSPPKNAITCSKIQFHDLFIIRKDCSRDS